VPFKPRPCSQEQPGQNRGNVPRIIDGTMVRSFKGQLEKGQLEKVEGVAHAGLVRQTVGGGI